MIPDYQSFMRPLLEIAADGREWKLGDAIEEIAKRLSITNEDRKALLPSGRQGLLENRVGWAKTYLKKAGLLDNPRRGTFVITERGRESLKQAEKINSKYLTRFAEFQEFHSAKPEQDQTETFANIETPTPEELLELNYLQIRRTVADDLLTKVKQATPQFFERLVVELLVAMGYGGSLVDAGQAIGKSGDEGIDGIIKEDKLGLDVIYIQAKRWEGTISRPEIQKFAGALQGQRAKKGVFITTSKYTKEAIDFAAKVESRIILIDGEQLANYMIDFGLGVSDVATYAIKRVDSDYFVEE
jgi:restriction system protein